MKLTMPAPHWHQFNHWREEPEFTYVPLEAAALLPQGFGQLVNVQTPDGRENIIATQDFYLGAWREAGDKLDAYILRVDDRWCLGVRYGPGAGDYFSPGADPQRAEALFVFMRSHEVTFDPPREAQSVDLPDPEDLARDFAAALYHAFTAEEWLTMMDRNRELAEAGSDACASQDFCDANMVMDSCFQDLCGTSASNFGDDHPQQDAAHDVWNKAWGIAKRRWLTAGRDQEAPARAEVPAWLFAGFTFEKNEHGWAVNFAGQPLSGGHDSEQSVRNYALYWLQNALGSSGVLQEAYRIWCQQTDATGEDETTAAEMADIVSQARDALDDARGLDAGPAQEDLLDTAHQYLFGDMVTRFIEKHRREEEEE